MKSFAIDISPTKTHTFIKKHKIIPPKLEEWKLVWYLENDCEYWIYLEYWVKWREYKYHKWPPTNDSTVFFEWVWNQTYKRTAEEFRK
jgi:hypothetical protein